MTGLGMGTSSWTLSSGRRGNLLYCRFQLKIPRPPSSSVWYSNVSKAKLSTTGVVTSFGVRAIGSGKVEQHASQLPVVNVCYANFITQQRRKPVHVYLYLRVHENLFSIETTSFSRGLLVDVIKLTRTSPRANFAPSSRLRTKPIRSFGS